MKRNTSNTPDVLKDVKPGRTDNSQPCPRTWIRNLGIPVELECKVRSYIKSHNMEIQFWGYESGNVVATIAGAGGFNVFGNTVRHVVEDRSLDIWSKMFYLTSEHPDTTVASGLCVLLLVAPLIRKPISKIDSVSLMNVIDTLLATFAILILLYALSSDTSWLSVSGAAFVVASSFLRYSKKNPLLLKIGGLVLASGGICLGMFGLDVLTQVLGKNSLVEITMASLTFGTGIYVTAASLLTYEGGIYQTDHYSSNEVRSFKLGWIHNLLDPKGSVIARCFNSMLDRPILALNKHIGKQIIFWVPARVKQRKPFKTSMLARLPWRIATALVALLSSSTQSWAFAVANTSWAIGDMAIGSEDW